MLAFVLPHTRIRKPADIRVPGEELREERGSAPMEAANEHQSGRVDRLWFGHLIVDRPHVLSSSSARPGQISVRSGFLLPGKRRSKPSDQMSEPSFLEAIEQHARAKTSP